MEVDRNIEGSTEIMKSGELRKRSQSPSSRKRKGLPRKQKV